VSHFTVLFLANRTEWEYFFKIFSLISVFRVVLQVPLYQVWRKMSFSVKQIMPLRSMTGRLDTRTTDKYH